MPRIVKMDDWPLIVTDDLDSAIERARKRKKERKKSKKDKKEIKDEKVEFLKQKFFVGYNPIFYLNFSTENL